jgi:hypothetical protein
MSLRPDMTHIAPFEDGLQLRLAIDHVLERLDALAQESVGMDREAKAKWITNKMAARQYEHTGQPDGPDDLAQAVAESIMALSLM